MQGILIVSIGWERAHSGRLRGKTARGRGQGGRSVATLVVKERMRKTPAAQNGPALPLVRCASPPGKGHCHSSHVQSIRRD